MVIQSVISVCFHVSVSSSMIATVQEKHKIIYFSVTEIIMLVNATG